MLIIQSVSDRIMSDKKHRVTAGALALAFFLIHAAALIHASHPDLSPETITTFLMLNTFVELFWMQNEDPWQDRGAASWCNSDYASAYEETYQEYARSEEEGGKGYEFGIRIDDLVYDVDLPIINDWRIASHSVPIATQGIGPNAVIIGDLLRAAEYDSGSAWQTYFPDIELEGKKEEEKERIAVEIALDPELSVRAVALVYDVKLRELNSTIFSNPAVRMPDDAYPTFRDPQDS